MKVKKSTAYALHALMYMVRHITQLPTTTVTIAKAEGIPSAYLSKIFQKLVKSEIVRAVKGRKKGYIFAKPPEEISLLDLIESVEGSKFFDECFLKDCECEGTTENCFIYSIWYKETREIKKLLKETSVATAAWNHPQHRFLSLATSLDNPENQQKIKTINFSDISLKKRTFIRSPGDT